jgi:manganese-dependent inorganic pyrophosphatase
MESGLEPAGAAAGALLCGILSDTLGLKMSTTTRHDVRAVEYLAPIAGVDPAALGPALLEQGMDLSGAPLAAILSRDTKEFELSGKKAVISQVMVPSFAWDRERSGEIVSELAAIRNASRADMVLVLFTSVPENASEVYGVADGSLMTTLLGDSLPAHFDGVMSRKKDFLPWLGERMRELSRQ